MAMSHNRKGYWTKECLMSTFKNTTYSRLFNKGNKPNESILMILTDGEDDGEDDNIVTGDDYCDCSSCQGYNWWEEIASNLIPGTRYYMNVNCRQAA